jgi:predicted protein tyrosine phosphatase
MFERREDLEVASAGLAPDADQPITPELLDWAQLIMVMEPIHRSRLQRRFASHLRHVRIVCLNIPDNYEFMDEVLVGLLGARAEPQLRRRR